MYTQAKPTQLQYLFNTRIDTCHRTPNKMSAAFEHKYNVAVLGAAGRLSPKYLSTEPF